MTLIFFLVLSFLPIFFYQLRYSAECISPIFIYCAFSFLYSFFPLSYVLGFTEVVTIELPFLDFYHVSIMVYFVIFINILLYFLLILLPFRFSKPVLFFDFNLSCNLGNSPILIFLVFYPIAFGMVYYFPWPKFGETPSFMTSIATFLKTAVLLVFCSLAIRKRNGRMSFFPFLFCYILILVINVIDTARTQLFIATFLCLFANKVTIYNLIKRFYLVLVFLMIFLYITLSRTGIEFSLGLFLWPFYSEGIFGSYGVLNVIGVQLDGVSNSMSFIYWFTDILFSFFPEFIYDALNFKYDFYVIDLIKMANDSAIFSGKLYPLGGHFYMSEYMMYFSWFFPFFFVFSFVFYLNLISRMKSEVYVFFLCSFFMFVKSPSVVLIKTFVVVFLCFCFFRLVFFIIPKKNIR
ncbi:hypothetical protein [Marinomonas polaris]|uniref:hypothetical protein n=1 Tax=Marinomonas polaris TaxID=293552 RepID=UPI003F992B28